MLLFLFFLLLPTQLGYHFWPSWSFVAGRPIDYLSPTLYLTDLLIILLLFLNIKKIYSFIKPLLKIHLKLVVLVLIGIIFNVLASHSVALTMFTWLRVLEYLLFGIFLFINQKSLFDIQLPLSLGILWTCILSLLQFTAQSNLGGLWYFLGERSLQITNSNVAKIIIDSELILRPYATFPHPNSLAGFLLVSYWLINQKIIKLLIAITLLLTFSRTAIIVFIFLNILSIKNKRIKLFGILSFGICLFLGFLDLGLLSSSIQERLFLFTESFKLFISHSIIGVGLGAFIPALSPSSPNLLQPVHNIYMLLITELGLVLVLILGFILMRFKHYFEFRGLASGYSNFGFAILSILLTGLADHYWLTSHQNQLLLVLVIVLCLNPKKIEIES